MFLYDLTLQKPSSINIAISGSFTGPKLNEIVASRGPSTLELFRHDATSGKLVSILVHDVFGVIRSLLPFRLVGASKDYIIVGSDSGRIVILEYNETTRSFEKVHQETFGKSGCRRVVPGQYLATDPKGRATMIAAIEKSKFVYVLNRDAQARLTISSPLEAHKSQTIVYSCVGVDVGFENPIFACLEVDYTEADEEENGLDATEKVLTYYELDLGLNHVVRRWSDPVDQRSNLLIAVPGGNDGPGGVLVCSENFITWKNQGAQEVKISIPRRKNPLDNLERGTLIVNSCMHKTKAMFFILVQTEDGDLFKLTLKYEKNKVKQILIKYFDTVAVSTSLCILKTGFLFVSNEFGNHQVFQIQSLGEDEPDITYNDGYEEFVYFEPRLNPKNLLLIEVLETLDSLLDCKVLNLSQEETPQFYTICGRGPESNLKILRHGLEVSEMAVSELPGNPTAVWTVKLQQADEYDAFIIVSFNNATIVLSIGETVEEVNDSGFNNGVQSLNVFQMEDSSFVQVHSQGIRHISKKVNEWKVPRGNLILYSTCNKKQIVIGLSSGEIVYFELNETGSLNEYQEKKHFNSGICSLSVGDVQEGRKRSRFLAVGCDDCTVRIVSLDPEDCLQPLSMQALSARPTSLLITEMTENQLGSDKVLYLMIGLENGVFIKLVMDELSGALSDARTRFLGPKAIKMVKITVNKDPAVLCLSTRPWLYYHFQHVNHLTPIFYDYLENAWNFQSEQCNEGIVAVSGNTLRIFTLEKLGQTFSQTNIPLKYTPRRLIVHPEFKNFITIEADHNMLSISQKEKLLEEKTKDADSMVEEYSEEELPEYLKGPIRGENGDWASCLRILNPFSGETSFCLDFKENEAAFSVTTCGFYGRPGESFLIVGTAKDVVLSPRNFSTAYIYVYKFSANGESLELVHQTPVDDIPYALCGFQGRLLVGLGRCLRIYDLGKKKLLRKCESKAFPNCIISIQTNGDRIVAGDIQESFHFVLYRPDANQFFIFADDTLPRWLTCSVILDGDTIAGGDKFGNFFVARLPAHISQDLQEDPSGNRLLTDKPYLQGAPHKLEQIVNYHVGDIITSLNKTNLVFGGREVLVYTTLQGGIGVLVPFITKDDVEFFQLLETFLREEALSLVGRDHLWYRSYYMPCKNVIDGNLCEQFMRIPLERKEAIAKELDRTCFEVIKRIQDIRTSTAF